MTVVAIALTPWGKQSGAHFNPALTLTFYRLRKVALWDAVFYCIAQLLGAVGGVALAAFALHGAPAHKAIHCAATVPGIYGIPIAFAAELAISFILMSAVLFALNHETLEPYAHYVAATLIATYIAFESPLSGMSTNPARTFGPAVCSGYWHAFWIYFIAPPLGMLAAAQVLLARKSKVPHCAKLHHHNDKRCIFCQPWPDLTVPNKKEPAMRERKPISRDQMIAFTDGFSRDCADDGAAIQVAGVTGIPWAMESAQRSCGSQRR